MSGTLTVAYWHLSTILVRHLKGVMLENAYLTVFLTITLISGVLFSRDIKQSSDFRTLVSKFEFDLPTFGIRNLSSILLSKDWQCIT